RLGARQRGLEIQHVLQARDIVADRAHRGARQHRREQGRESGTHDAESLIILSYRSQACRTANMSRLPSLGPLPFAAGVLYLRLKRRTGRPTMAMTMNGEVQLAAPREAV